MQINTVASPIIVHDRKPAASQVASAFFGCQETSVSSNEAGVVLQLKIPSFGELIQEPLFSGPAHLYEVGGFHLAETDDLLVGVYVHQMKFPLSEPVREAYQSFLLLTANWNLYRVWNYVPFINQDTNGLENYKSFCKGRSIAFEDYYGRDFDVRLPAASAVGIGDDKFVMYFIAGRREAVHLENPEQVSAFRYPVQYGPRSPSFARGTVAMIDGKKTGFVSGTASIKGHESVTLQSIPQQLYTTLDNMSLVFEQMNFVERMSYSSLMPDPARYERHFKVYIRHASDAARIKSLFEEALMVTGDDRIVYLQADICRSDLDLEIEAIVRER